MDLLHSLKTSTSQYHQQIEQIDLLKKIITNEITLPEYKKLLSQLYGFINPCEKIIKQKFHYAIEGREKSSLLHIDLLELNCTISSDFLFCGNLPALNTIPDVFGYLYVLEGSTLGGQMITKLLKKNRLLSKPSVMWQGRTKKCLKKRSVHKVHEHFEDIFSCEIDHHRGFEKKSNVHSLSMIPTRYFNAYDKQTKKKWDAFLTSLLNHDFDDSQKKNLIKSAINTFSSLLNWLKYST